MTRISSLPISSSSSINLSEVASQHSTSVRSSRLQLTSRSCTKSNKDPQEVKTATMANSSKPQSLLLAMTLTTILLLIMAASIDCHYAKRTQYHEQGLHGPKSYKFGYTTGDHKNPMERHEVSDGHGHVKGWYSFVDANGKHQVVHYEASKYGFRVLSHKKPYNNGKRHYNS